MDVLYSIGRVVLLIGLAVAVLAAGLTLIAGLSDALSTVDAAEPLDWDLNEGGGTPAGFTIADLAFDAISALVPGGLATLVGLFVTGLVLLGLIIAFLWARRVVGS